MSLWFETACQFILIDHKIENMPKHTFHKHFHTNSLSTLQSKCYLDKGSESTSLWGLAVCLHRLQTTEHLFMLGRAPAWRAICSWLSPDCVGPWKKHSKLPSLPQTHSPMSMEAQKANGGTGKAVHRRQEWHLLTLLHSFVRAAGAAQPQRWTVLPAFSPCQSWPTEIPHNKSELVHPRTTNRRRVFSPATSKEQIAFGRCQFLPRAGIWGSFVGRNSLCNYLWAFTPKTESNFIFRSGLSWTTKTIFG